jgi:hypothetical protein
MLRAPSRPPDQEQVVRSRLPYADRYRDETFFERFRRKPPLAILIPVGVVLLLLIVLGFAFGPIVRGRVQKEADRRKLDIEVGSVRPGFFAVSLRDVKVKPRGVAGIEAKLDDVHVDLTAGLSLQEVKAKGGSITVEGELEDVIERLTEFRKSSSPAASSSSSSSPSKTPMSVEGVSFSWKLPSGGEFTGAGLRAARDANSIKLGCSTCSASHLFHGAKIIGTVTNADIELGPDGAPRKIVILTLDFAHEPTKRDTPKAPPTSTADLVPPPLPVQVGKKKGAKPPPPPAAASTPAAPAEPLLPFPDLHALRARLATAVTTIAARIPEGGNIEIGGLNVKLDVGGETMAFGPGGFSLKRERERLHLTFASAPPADGEKNAPGSGPKGTPLSIDADLPVNGAGEMSAHLAGGPVSLAVLGVKEGMKGLTDVSRGTVSGKGQLVLSPQADALTFDGQVALHGISLKEPRIAPETLKGIDFSLSSRGVLSDAGKLRVDDAQLDMRALHMKAHGTLEETPDHFAVALAMEVTPAACQALLDSAPQGLLPIVRSARIGGTFGANINLAFDTRTIDKLALDYRIDDQCRMLEVPRDMSREHFEGSFTYRTYHPDGTTGDTTTGPGSSNWTNLDDISPFMIVAVLTTEDGAFYKHKGFNHAAIRSSVQANLKARRFVRGASTITMQLAKNLFLARDKALSRKIEEVILTDYLEQAFRKDDMMELYLNIIEFGPDVYGITQAAEHYFGRKPEELSLAECFFLSSLLPSPLRYGKLRDKGEVSETWGNHLRALMNIAAKNNKITHAELEEGLKETVTFMRSGDPRSEPRKPVSTKRRDPSDDDDSGWRTLE